MIGPGEPGPVAGPAKEKAKSVNPEGGGEKLPSGLARLFGGSFRQSASAMDAAYSLVGSVLGLGLVGWLIDRHFESAPTWLLVGLLLGVVVGFYVLAKVVLWRR